MISLDGLDYDARHWEADAFAGAAGAVRLVSMAGILLFGSEIVVVLFAFKLSILD